MNRLTLFICMALVFLSVGCQKKAAPPKMPAPLVEAYVVKPKTIPLFVDTLGHFIPFNTVTIQAQVQGELTGLFFEEGQVVCPGDLLFTIDKRPYQADLDKAIATLKQNEATLAYNRSRQERYSYLVDDDFVSKLQYTQYVTELESQLAVIQENKAEIDRQAINVGYCTITSPIYGVTGKKLIDVGNIITDVGTKMLVINQIAPLYIDFSIPERYFEVVRKNQLQKDLNIEIYLPNTNVRTLAKLQMIDNTINPNTGMVALRGILPNKNHFFWPQQFVRIRLIIDEIPNALSVPAEALVSTTKGVMVWVIQADQTVCPRYVDVGEEYEGKAHIIKGLKPFDKVVTKGQVKLKEGIKVDIKGSEKGKCS